MSKMSNISAELEEQAAELGFESVAEAEENGYVVVYQTDRATLEAIDFEAEQEKAHEAWLKEKEQVMHDLMDLREMMNELESPKWQELLTNAISFVRDCKE